MYRDFYYLEYVPFTVMPDADLANLSRRHQLVLQRVVKGLNKQQSVIVLLGEAGLSKVELLCSALAKNKEPKYKTIVIDVRKIHFQNQIYFNDIVKAVYQEIGYEIKYQVSPDALIDLHDIFIEERQKDSHFVIIVEHAHLLPPEVLKRVPQLIDIYPYEQPLAQLILSGEPVLDKYLRDSNLQPLKKRIQLVAKLDTFNRRESMAYIQRKLSLASQTDTPKVFTKAATRKIVKAANGIPRNLNMLCTDALVAGCRRHKRPIPVSIVKQVLDDFHQPRSRRDSRFVWLSAFVLLVAVLMAGMSFRDSFGSYIQTAAQWPQQAFKQVQPLWFDLTQKAATLRVQATKKERQPGPVEAPVTTPPERPSPHVVTPPPAPQIATKPSPSAAMVDAPKPPVSQVLDEALPKPQDNAMQQVAALIDQHFPKGGAFDLNVWSNKASGDNYVEGEHLILYVTSETSAFLRIDYYQADGQIVQLLPHPLISNQVQAGQRFTLGEPGNVFQFKVSPPFGMEMLTVVASQKPMKTQRETTTGELNRSYVERLSHQLEAYIAQGDVAAAYVRIQTQPKDGTRAEGTGLQPISKNEHP